MAQENVVVVWFDEPSKAYRQNLRQRDDTTYMNLGTRYGSPAKGVGQPATNAITGTEPS